jgi:hypothetical protein
MVECRIDSWLQRGIDCNLLMGERRHEAGATFQSGKLKLSTVTYSAHQPLLMRPESPARENSP